MYKTINIIFAVIVNLFYNIILYANNIENKLAYKVNNATDSILITEKTSQQKTYKFSDFIDYSLTRADFIYQENDSYLASYSIYRKTCNYKTFSNITKIGTATSFVDVINISENTKLQFAKNNSLINNQQLNSTKKLLLLLNKIQQEKIYLFIPELVPMLINWGKIYQINPLVSIQAINVNLDNLNEIIFTFSLSTIVDYLYFIKPEYQQYLSNITDNSQKKIFNITGDCKINFESNQKEFRLLTASGEVLLYLQAMIEDKTLSASTINSMQNNIIFIINNESEIQYTYNTNESVGFNNHENYMLINNLNSNYSTLSNMYGLYLVPSNKKIITSISTLPLYSVDKCMSLQEICTETTQNKQYYKLDYVLSEIQANNYKLFIPDLIPIINKWYKTGIIHPLVIIDKKYIDYNSNEAIINFHLEQILSLRWLNNATDIQYLSRSKYDTSLCNFRIKGSCKINLQTNKRLTCLLDNNGKIIYTSEYL